MAPPELPRLVLPAEHWNCYLEGEFLGACLKGKNSSEGLSLSYDLLSTIKQSHNVFHIAGNKLTQEWVAEKILHLLFL